MDNKEFSRIFSEFATYLTGERGLASATREGYLQAANDFAAGSHSTDGAIISAPFGMAGLLGAGAIPNRLHNNADLHTPC